VPALGSQHVLKLLFIGKSKINNKSITQQPLRLEKNKRRYGIFCCVFESQILLDLKLATKFQVATILFAR
jgi:hypothetical protein